MDLKVVYGILEVLAITEWGNWLSNKTELFPWLFNFDWQVGLWWASMTIFSILNILAWWRTYNWFRKESRNWFPKDLSFVKTQLFLSAGYVFVCAFRSIVPRADVQKIVLWDTWFSSILVGRSLATIAELCLAGQLAFFLNFIAKKYDSSPVRIISFSIFPILFLAEWFSWYSVLTTNYIGNTIEESLWCTSGILLTISSMIIFGKTYGKEKLIFITMGFYSTLYVIFMMTVDVPMYFNRFLNDSLQGKVYFTLLQGFHEINTNWKITHSYSDWEGELAWMFLYFTTAVWGSIGIIRTPFILESSRISRSYRQEIFIQKVRNT